MGKQIASNKAVVTRIFRRIISQLQNDAEFKRVFAGNIRSWDGSLNDKAPFTPSPNKPIVRLTPTCSNQIWFSPDAQIGQLTIITEMAIASLCIDDVADAYDILITALSPFQRELVRDLVENGAETGEIVFTDPEMVAKPETQPQGLFLAVGKFRLNYVRMMNPCRTEPWVN